MSKKKIIRYPRTKITFILFFFNCNYINAEKISYSLSHQRNLTDFNSYFNENPYTLFKQNLQNIIIHATFDQTSLLTKQFTIMKNLVILLTFCLSSTIAFSQAPDLGDSPGCAKSFGQNFVQCYNCWSGEGVPNPIYAPGCYGQNDRPCGVCVRIEFNEATQKYEVIQFDPEGNVTFHRDDIEEIITSTGSDSEGVEYTIYEFTP